MKKIISIILSTVMLLSLCACGSENSTTQDSETNQRQQNAEEMVDNSKKERAPIELEYETYKASTYKIGTDMPAGEYVLFSDSFSGYFEIDKDSSGSFDSIIANDNFETNSIVTVDDGQYLKLSGCYAIPLKNATKLDLSSSGMFAVGANLPEGEYKIEVDENSSLGYGYVEVSSSSNHSFSSIVSNDNFEGATYIAVKDGQYLTLSECHIVNPPAVFLDIDARTLTAYMLHDDIQGHIDGYRAAGDEYGIYDELLSQNDAASMYTILMDDFEKYMFEEPCLYEDFWSYIFTVYSAYVEGYCPADVAIGLSTLVTDSSITPGVFE